MRRAPVIRARSLFLLACGLALLATALSVWRRPAPPADPAPDARLGPDARPGAPSEPDGPPVGVAGARPSPEAGPSPDPRRAAPGAPARSDAPLHVAPIVASDSWARGWVWSRGVAVVLLPGRFPAEPRVSAQVLDSEGRVVLERRPCPVVRTSTTELIVVLPVGPRRSPGRVRVELADDGAEPCTVEIPLPPMHEAMSTIELAARRLFGFPGDSAVHRGYLEHLRLGGSRRDAIERAERHVAAVAAFLERDVELSPMNLDRLREATRRIRDESLANLRRAASDAK